MRPAALLLAASAFAAAVAMGEERAVYRARGTDAGLFDQYDNDGYSLAVVPGPGGSAELRVRVFDGPLRSSAPFPRPLSPEGAVLAEAPERDLFARRLTLGSRSEEEAVRRLLLGLRAELRYDPDRLRRQDPSAVFTSRRGYCVGFAELAVDLLRRVGIPARTVQGVLRTEPGSDHYDPKIQGAYHRWIEVHYPDRGYVFSDPWTSINGVDARYVPFARQTLRRPGALTLEAVGSRSGRLSYESVGSGATRVRVRGRVDPGTGGDRETLNGKREGN